MSEPIVRFKCGRCKREGKQVVPVEQKGLAEMVVAEDGLCHFRWATRPNQDVELDLILFEGDASFKRVGKVHDGRVFYLDWINGDQKEFFWMQEPNDDNDQDIMDKVNDYLKPPAALVDAMQEEKKKEEAPPPAAAPTPATTTSSSSSNNNLVSSEFLAGLLQQMPAAAAGGGRGPSLLDVFDSRQLSEALQNAPEVLEGLLPYLPEVDRTPHGLFSFLSSPQFQQAVAAFNAALHQGHQQEILRQLDCAGAAPVTDASVVGYFLRTVEKHLSSAEKKQ